MYIYILLEQVEGTDSAEDQKNDCTSSVALKVSISVNE